MVNKKLLILSLSIIQFAVKAGSDNPIVNRLEKTVNDITVQINGVKDTTLSEIDATFDSLKGIAKEMQTNFVNPVQTLVGDLKLIPKKFKEAAQKIKNQDMQGLSEMGDVTRDTVSNTLRTASSLIKSVTKLSWASPFSHLANILQTTVLSLNMLKDILISSSQDLTQVTKVAVKKSISQIDAMIKQFNLLITQSQNLART